jgi:hypothetical protein
VLGELDFRHHKVRCIATAVAVIDHRWCRQA